MGNSSTKPIRIDLDASRHANVFRGENRVQSAAFEKFTSCLNRVANATAHKNVDAAAVGSDSPARASASPGHEHAAILILGARGIGKSSFMLSAQEDFRSEREGGPTLLSLGLFEPEKMEDHEQPLVSIVGWIESAMREKADDAMRRRHTRQFETVQEAYLQLARRLPALYDDAYRKALGESLGEAELAGELLRERAQSASELARTFREYVKAWIQFFRGSDSMPQLQAVVLMLDDIDTRLHGGMHVLETIRRYMSFPELIVIASGDLRLFDMVLRLKQAGLTEALGLTIRPELQKSDDMELLRETREQYLRKLFPQENRIELQPANQLFDYHVFIKNGTFTIDPDGRPLSTLLEAFIEKFLLLGKLPEHDKALARATQFALLTKATRTALDVIETVLVPAVSEPVDRRAVLEALLAVFSAELDGSGLNLHSFLRGDSHAEHEFVLSATRNAVLQGAEGNQRIEALYNVTPSYTSERANRLAICSLAAINERYRNHELHYLKYWLVVVEPHLNWEAQAQEEKSKYLDFLHLAKGEQPADIAGRDVAWQSDQLLVDRTGTPRSPGVLKLQNGNAPNYRYRILIGNGQAKESLRAISSFEPWCKKVAGKVSDPKHWFPTWKEFSELVPLAHAFAAPFIVRVVSRIGVPGQHIFVDFRRGLGFLCQLVERTGSDADTNIAAFALEEALQERVYVGRGAVTAERVAKSTKTSQSGSGEEEAESDSDVGSSVQPRGGGDDSTSQLSEELVSWLKFARARESGDSLGLPSDVAAAIWRRFHFNLTIQADPKNVAQKDCTLGEFLRRSTLAFLHAIVVEELTHHAHELGFADRLDRRNLVNSPEVLVHNLKLIKTQSIKNPLKVSSIWLACPLLRALLSESDLAALDDESTESSQSYDPRKREYRIQVAASSELVASKTLHPFLCAVRPWQPGSKAATQESADEAIGVWLGENGAGGHDTASGRKQRS